MCQRRTCESWVGAACSICVQCICATHGCSADVAWIQPGRHCPYLSALQLAVAKGVEKGDNDELIDLHTERGHAVCNLRTDMTLWHDAHVAGKLAAPAD